MNKFTKGNFVRDKYGNIRCDKSKGVEGSLQISGVSMPMYGNKEIEANTELTFTAFTTATKLSEQGFDAVKVLDVLPELIANAEVGSVARVYELLEQCRGDV